MRGAPAVNPSPSAFLLARTSGRTALSPFASRLRSRRAITTAAASRAPSSTIVTTSAPQYRGAATVRITLTPPRTSPTPPFTAAPVSLRDAVAVKRLLPSPLPPPPIPPPSSSSFDAAISAENARLKAVLREASTMLLRYEADRQHALSLESSSREPRSRAKQGRRVRRKSKQQQDGSHPRRKSGARSSFSSRSSNARRGSILSRGSETNRSTNSFDDSDDWSSTASALEQAQVVIVTDHLHDGPFASLAGTAAAVPNSSDSPGALKAWRRVKLKAFAVTAVAKGQTKQTLRRMLRKGAVFLVRTCERNPTSGLSFNAGAWRRCMVMTSTKRVYVQSSRAPSVNGLVAPSGETEVVFRAECITRIHHAALPSELDADQVSESLEMCHGDLRRYFAVSVLSKGVDDLIEFVVIAPVEEGVAAPPPLADVKYAAKARDWVDALKYLAQKRVRTVARKAAKGLGSPRTPRGELTGTTHSRSSSITSMQSENDLSLPEDRTAGEDAGGSPRSAKSTEHGGSTGGGAGGGGDTELRHPLPPHVDDLIRRAAQLIESPLQTPESPLQTPESSMGGTPSPRRDRDGEVSSQAQPHERTKTSASSPTRFQKPTLQPHQVKAMSPLSLSRKTIVRTLASCTAKPTKQQKIILKTALSTSSPAKSGSAMTYDDPFAELDAEAEGESGVQSELLMPFIRVNRHGSVFIGGGAAAIAAELLDIGGEGEGDELLEPKVDRSSPQHTDEEMNLHMRSMNSMSTVNEESELDDLSRNPSGSMQSLLGGRHTPHGVAATLVKVDEDDKEEVTDRGRRFSVDPFVMIGDHEKVERALAEFNENRDESSSDQSCSVIEVESLWTDALGTSTKHQEMVMEKEKEQAAERRRHFTRAMHLFRTVDTDQSGSVDLDELVQIITTSGSSFAAFFDRWVIASQSKGIVLAESLTERARECARELMTEFDTDKNSTLERAEFIRLFKTMWRITDEENSTRAMALFDEVDTNHDGIVTTSELQQIIVSAGSSFALFFERWLASNREKGNPLPLSEKERAHMCAIELMHEFDTDGNGWLDRSEFIRLFRY